MYSWKHNHHRLDVVALLCNRIYDSAWNPDFSVVYIQNRKEL